MKKFKAGDLIFQHMRLAAVAAALIFTVNSAYGADCTALVVPPKDLPDEVQLFILDAKNRTINPDIKKKRSELSRDGRFEECGDANYYGYQTKLQYYLVSKIKIATAIKCVCGSQTSEHGGVPAGLKAPRCESGC